LEGRFSKNPLISVGGGVPQNSLIRDIGLGGSFPKISQEGILGLVTSWTTKRLGFKALSPNPLIRDFGSSDSAIAEILGKMVCHHPFPQNLLISDFGFSDKLDHQKAWF